MTATDDTFTAVRSVLARTLQLDGKAASLTRGTELLGSLEE